LGKKKRTRKRKTKGEVSLSRKCAVGRKGEKGKKNQGQKKGMSVVAKKYGRREADFGNVRKTI